MISILEIKKFFPEQFENTEIERFRSRLATCLMSAIGIIYKYFTNMIETLITDKKKGYGFKKGLPKVI